MFRFLTRRGFGVHSTFAFRFIREVIGEKWPYYAYVVVKDDVQRLLFRVTVALCPTQVKSVGNASDQGVHHAGRGYAKPAHWIGVESTRLAIVGAKTTGEEAARLLEEGWCLFIMPEAVAARRQAKSTLGALRHGMLFDLKHGPAIAIPFTHIPNQNFLL